MQARGVDDKLEELRCELVRKRVPDSSTSLLDRLLGDEAKAECYELWISLHHMCSPFDELPARYMCGAIVANVAAASGTPAALARQ